MHRSWAYARVVCLAFCVFLLACVEEMGDDTAFSIGDAWSLVDAQTHSLSTGFAFGPSCVDGLHGSSCTTEWGSEGVCASEVWGYTYCAPLGSCAGDSAGMSCTMEWGESGICVPLGERTLCRSEERFGVENEEDAEIKAPRECDFSAVGAPCTTSWGLPGRCVQVGPIRPGGAVLGFVCEETSLGELI